MPDRRMIHRKITVSSDVADLIEAEGPAAGLFWTWLIPFYDRYGCVPDDPRALKAMVVPALDDITTKDVRRFVAWIVRRKMLVRVKGPGGACGLRNPHFEEHQTGATLEREAPSPYEPPGRSKALRRPPRSRSKGSQADVTPERHPDVPEDAHNVSKVPTAPTRRRTKATTKTPPNAGGSRPGRDRVVTGSGEGRKEGRKPPTGVSPSPLPPTPDSAGPPSPSPSAPSAPGVNGRGTHEVSRVDAEKIDAVLPSTVRAERKAERARSGGDR